MSRLLPDRAADRPLAAARSSAARWRGFPRQRVVATSRAACDPAFGASPGRARWPRSSALRRCRGPARSRWCCRTISCATRSCPGATRSARRAEEDALVRFHFAKIHGERAKTWEAARRARARRARRASPAPSTRALLEALGRRFAKGGKARLVSVQPQLMRSVQRAGAGAFRREGAWLVLAEPDRACVALLAGGRWRAVQNGKEPLARAARARALPRARRRPGRASGPGAARRRAAAGRAGRRLEVPRPHMTRVPRVELDYLAPVRRAPWTGLAVLALSLAVAGAMLENYRGVRAGLAQLEAQGGLAGPQRGACARCRRNASKKRRRAPRRWCASSRCPGRG